ncbi:HTH_Tnp_Tc3_2 domain-containing protein [Trichonephila clavipes]|nr:HTH_Tnp_Tc3_2 domain-containing protein [Trichonephila clavipes]
MPLKIRRIKGLMHFKSVEAQNVPGSGSLERGCVLAQLSFTSLPRGSKRKVRQRAKVVNNEADELSLKLTLILSVRELYLPLAYISFLVRLAARRLHESNLLESSSNAFKVTGSKAYHHLSCCLATLDLNTLSNLNIPYLFLELIGNKREFIFPKKTPKKIGGKAPYRFVTHFTRTHDTPVMNPPSAPSISGYEAGKSIKAGDLQKLSCVSSGGNPPATLKWFKNDKECNNRIVMAQRKHLDDFLRGRIIGRLECGRTQLEVSVELGIVQSVISRL